MEIVIWFHGRNVQTFETQKNARAPATTHRYPPKMTASFQSAKTGTPWSAKDSDNPNDGPLPTGRMKEPIKESRPARKARRKAVEQTERERQRRGLDFRLPQWYEIPRLLPDRGELLGSLHASYRTCQNAACRCHDGEKIHGPYWYRHWRGENGRQHKTYVKRSDVKRVRRAIEQRRRRVELEREKRNEHMRRGKYARHRLSESGGSLEA